MLKRRLLVEFDIFISRLEEVRDIGLIENGYSHIIYNVIYNHVLNSDYMLVDVSTYKRTYKGIAKNKELLGEGLCAVPDFVITNKVKSLENINRLGCIEVKFHNEDVDAHLAEGDNVRLERKDDKKGYLEIYNHHVIYTNGWKWNYYDGSKSDPCWEVDFSKEDQRNAATYYDLIMKLNQIEWYK